MDSRYHVASLVAIFLALGVGIIIGSTIVGENFSRNVVESQDKMILRLEQDYLKLKDETQKNRQELVLLQDTVAFYKQFAQETFPELVKGRLAGYGLAVISLGQDPPEALLKCLELADAQVNTLITLEPELAEIAVASGTSIAASLSCSPSPAEIQQALAAGLLKLWQEGNQNIIDIMWRFALGQVKGVHGRISTVIILDNSSNGGYNSHWLKPMTDYLEREGLNVYWLADNEFSLDTIPGQLEVIRAISGGEELKREASVNSR